MAPLNFLARILFLALGDRPSRPSPPNQFKNAKGGAFCVTVFYQDSRASAKAYYNDPHDALQDLKQVDENKLVAWTIVHLPSAHCWAYWLKDQKSETDVGQEK
jgi:hypothetical protein